MIGSVGGPEVALALSFMLKLQKCKPGGYPFGRIPILDILYTISMRITAAKATV